MNIETIIETNERLNEELRIALATMNLKSDVTRIRNEIKENQERCPHYSANFQWSQINNTCPYCGKKMGE